VRQRIVTSEKVIVRRVCGFALLVATLMVGGPLGGCSQKSETAAGGAVPAQPATTASAKNTAEADDLREALVSAVPAGQSSDTIDLRFSLDTPPMPGKPLQVRIAVIPTIAFASLQVVFQGGEALTIDRAATQVGPITNPQPGVAISHRLTVVPQREGIYSISATVLVENDDLSIARTFAIPLIVGTGPAASR
jgi:hypothetical protein